MKRGDKVRVKLTGESAGHGKKLWGLDWDRGGRQRTR